MTDHTIAFHSINEEKSSYGFNANIVTEHTMALHSINDENSSYGLNPNNKTTIGTQKFEIINNNIVFDSNFDSCCDIINIKAFKFENVSPDFNLETINIRCGNLLITQLHMDIVQCYGTNIKTEIIQDNKHSVIYEIPSKQLKLNDLLKISSYYDNIVISLKCSGTYDRAYLFCNTKYLNDNIREKHMTKPCDTVYLEMFKQPVNHKHNISTHEILFKGLCNGIFIQGINMNKINNIKIYITSPKYSIINYDMSMIYFNCVKLNDNCFYLPFDSNKTFTNCDLNNSINLSCLRLSLEMDCESFQGNIYTCVPNILGIHEGIAYTRFNH